MKLTQFLGRSRSGYARLRPDPIPSTPADIIRAELFSLERLEQHAESLAAAQRCTMGRGISLLPRVKENRRVLSLGYQSIVQSIHDDHSITPAAEWLVDNFHVLEDQIREIIDDLPPGFYHKLPKLADGHLKGYARVYGVAWAFVAHTDSRFDPDWLRRFVRAYQRSHALHIGEVWALAINLRIVLVENLRRLCDRITSSKTARSEADALADRILGLKGEVPVDLDATLRDYEGPRFTRAFAVQLVQRLRDQEQRGAPVFKWLDARLATQQTTADEIVRQEHQDQAAMNTTARNVITSMRVISTLDWSQFFEDVSVVDEILRRGEGFGAMDFATRDLYRHAIEDLSRGSDVPEPDIAARVVSMAASVSTSPDKIDVDHERRADAGYYLVSRGRLELEKQIGYRPSLRRYVMRAYVSWATPAYLATMAATALGFLWVPWHTSHAAGLNPFFVTALGLLSLFPASDAAVSVINRLVTASIGPRPLPKLDFSLHIPDVYRTLVAMPVLINDPATVDEYVERLEIHYLGNSDDNLRFALVTDWSDAAQESLATDAALVEQARKGIAALNQRYPLPTEEPRFYVFHRKRLWNAEQGVWMGWERKRGKLDELNLLLRGDLETTFVEVGAVPAQIRYVITLDADTHMARGTAAKLIGAMAHPLNRPRTDPIAGRVIEGYGLMQPRITATLPESGFGSIYQRIYSGSAGIDPYAFAVSDVYQDLFKEGSYTGKGIYEVDVFHNALAGRVPENRLLSHDLFEGLFVRTALLTDVELFEEFPAHYEVSVARAHRWVRGDWQLLPWIIGRGYGPRSNHVPWIGEWKMVDNLRRSLSAPAAFAAFTLSWTLPLPQAERWTGFLVGMMALPYWLPILFNLIPRRSQTSWRHHWNDVWADMQTATEQTILSLTFLAHQAWMMTDAVGRTLYRLAISHRRMLEWVSAALQKNIFDYNILAIYRRMFSAVVLAGAAWGVHARWGERSSDWLVWPFIGLWVLSPWIARRISVPLASSESYELSHEEIHYFRRLARKTWRFFETFVTAEQNNLPPDNFQEIPQPIVAHRTSPTNIGLYLLSIVSARDFGWIGIAEALERIEATFRSVEKLEHYKGHLLNWYDTKELRSLAPLYVSTVDSGNFAGHLWALAEACRQMDPASKNLSRVVEGARDHIRLITETVTAIDDDRRTGTVTVAQLRDVLSDLDRELATAPLETTDAMPFLRRIELKAQTLLDMARTVAVDPAHKNNQDMSDWADRLVRQVQSHLRDRSLDSATLAQRLEAIAQTCDLWVRDMRFDFLLDPSKKIFSIGFQVAEQKLDPSYYDLLASEARLASFVAIAKGDVPAAHWFRLSRSLRPWKHGMALLSWSGSMFEYLMPSLVMQPPVGSLLDQTNRSVVRRQIEYGGERNVPWGVSESGYNAQDVEFTYQYRNFGVPGLGLKRGLADDLLIAPYATALAAMVDPSAAEQNFLRLAKSGAEGKYGFYEALDYTTSRLPEDQTVAVVKEYMAHHQGMTLVSMANVIDHQIIRRYFHANPRVQATELLLQERTPRDVPVSRPSTSDARGDARPLVAPVIRRFYSPHEPVPRTHLLSNGRYSVMMTAAGSGYSKWRDQAVTRWREDATRDGWGSFIFLRDSETNEVWSAGYQPTGVVPDRYEVDFSEDRAEYVRQDGTILTTLEVVVSPEDDAEIRRVTIKNAGFSTREIEVTSYAEIVLTKMAADQAHPAFSNLFVQTEFVPEVAGLLATRRTRAPDDPTIWAAHVLVVDGEALGAMEYESDRAQFLGRGRGIRTPMCVIDGKPLSNTVGPVLDPILSLRRRIRLEPGRTARVTFSTMVAATRDEVMGLADKYHDLAMFERTVTLAWTQAQIQQQHLSITPSEAHLFQDIASRILYSNAGLRAAPERLARNTLGAPGLWAYSISGDLPIVLLRIDNEDEQSIVRELLRAHEYWRLRNLGVDLVILNEKGNSYIQELQNSLQDLVQTTQETLRKEVHATDGDIFVLRADQMNAEQRILLQTAARVIFRGRWGTLAQQLERLEESITSAESPPVPRKPVLAPPAVQSSVDVSRYRFYNGLGGFSEDGKEYVTVLGPGQWTPAPWTNVISNPNFGFQVTESGSGYTWSMNSRENQLTAWSNDPVSDPPSEAFYLRDEDSGHIWTPTVLPIREETSAYVAHHGQGYSRFEHVTQSIATDLLQFVPLDDSIKISRLRITNESSRFRRIRVTSYVDWVLGTSRSANVPYIVTERDAATGAILAHNPWNVEFANRYAFVDLSGKQGAWTADRTEFFGRNGTPDHPAAVEGSEPLSGRVGAGLDPCAALQTILELKPGASVDVIFFIGQAENQKKALELVRKYRSVDIDVVFQSVIRYWDSNLDAVKVHTPNPAMDLMLNRWLLYQTFACRLWARSAFYQAGGAYGFRDQLQDVMALTVSRRDVAREHILRTAARQFIEGDVQHWWHPPTGRGVRTKISDDLVWLPYVVNHYLEVTADKAILDEAVPFLTGQAVPVDKDDSYFQPGVSTETASLFEHCARALDARLTVGSHGLPLMGSGDWNDGMNRVGHEGKGESVWLAWFLHTTLWEFAKVAEARGESARAEKWRLHVGELKAALERHGWDGDWYRRAYFDDGQALGSHENVECQIDSIAQSWGVISGAADPARATRAMAALDDRLIRRKEKLSLLLTPPFNQSKPNPGYIQGYLPGVRENGGQYTHAAVWATIAFASLGDGDKAEELFGMLNPINHGSTRASIHRYKVEPYVAAGDVYAESFHSGRGGWTWYTGSAGWMYRAGIEWILGFRLRGTMLYMDPCIPKAWPRFELSFRYHAARYDVTVENPDGVCRGIKSADMDGKPVRGGVAIFLIDDGQPHHVRIVLGKE